MNNFPENQNNNSQEEFSTVFSDPKKHNEVNQKNGNKKRLLIILSAIAVIAVLVSGTFAAIKLIPEKQEESSTPSINEIEVLNYKETDYKTVTVENENGSFKFYSVITKAQDKEGTDTVNWYLDGYDKELISSANVSSVIDELIKISASREITEKSLADCGLEKPAIKANIVMNDGNEFSILLGSKSPDNMGMYIKLSTKDAIYLLNNSLDEVLTFEAIDFANSSSFAGVTLGSDYSDYTDQDKLVTFDTMTISGKNFAKTVVIEPNNDETTKTFAPYYMLSPERRSVENIDNIITAFAEGIQVSGAYSFDVSNKTIKTFGLDKPDFLVTVKIKDLSFTYKFKLQEDGNYAVINDQSKLIKKVSPSNVQFADYKVTDLYSKWVFIESINNVSNLTVKIDGKSHSFDIKKNPDKDFEESYIVTYNGNNLKSDNFQNFYQFCIALTNADFDVSDLDTSEEVSLKYTYIDNEKPPVTVSFKKSTATKYQYSLNGKAIGRVNSSEFKKINRYLQQLLDGEKVTY